MRTKYYSIILFLLVGVFFLGTLSGDNVHLTEVKDLFHVKRAPEIKNSVKPDLNFANIPLYFIQNKGQVDKRALFYAKTPGYTLWITKNGLVFDSVKIQESGDRSQETEGKTKSQIPDPKSFRDVSRLLFVGANKNTAVVSLHPQKYRVNYFKGNDKGKWLGGVPTSGAVLYKNVYKNIDLKVYGIGKQIEYDWVVHPGGNPDDIRFEYKNVKGVEINKEGDLDITTDFGKLKHKKPYSYQNVGTDPRVCLENGNNISKKGEHMGSPLQEISSSFKRINKTAFGFITGNYDKGRTLVIDPVVLAYSTFLGDYYSEGGYDVDIDSSGCAYVSGYTQSDSFPVTSGSVQTVKGNTYDAFVTKFSADGSSLEFSTFLGGNGRDWGSSIKVDHHHAVYVTGATESSDFPTVNAIDSTYNGGNGDAFVTKIVPDGSSLEYSTYLGGISVDRGYGIDVDSYGHAFVTGWTHSDDFPVKNQFQNYGGSKDIFVSRLDFVLGTLTLQYSTYLGGTGEEGATEIGIENAYIVFITGFTSSETFPTKNPLQSTYGGGNSDIILARFNTGQSGADSLVWSTYFGGNGTDSDSDICADGAGHPHIIFRTNSTDLATTTNAYQSSLMGGTDYFIASFYGGSTSPSLIRSTYLGGSGDEGDEDYSGIAVDGHSSVYVTGVTSSNDFPLSGQFQDYVGGTDAFVAKFLSWQLSSLEYSTYLGGNGGDFAEGIACDNDGNAYVTGMTYSSDFPLENPYLDHHVYNGDAFLTKLTFSPRVTASVAGTGGTVSPASQDVVKGNSASVDIYPENNYFIKSITDNGVSKPIVNPYFINNVQTDHEVVVTFSINTYDVTASVSGGNGSVSPASQSIDAGNSATINITPDVNYEIDTITDNGVSHPAVNPYVISNIQGDHNVVVTFKQLAFPPTLRLSGIRKSEKAWILSKDYTVLNILIVEHENPIPVSSYVLYKKVNGSWSELKSYGGAGTYEYTDKFLKKDDIVSYKLTAYGPDGSVVIESEPLTL